MVIFFELIVFDFTHLLLLLCLFYALTVDIMLIIKVENF